MLARNHLFRDLSVMYWAPTSRLEGTFLITSISYPQDFKQLLSDLFSSIAIWTSTPSFADMAMLSEDFNAKKMPGIAHFYFDGEGLTVKTAQKLRDRFPDARINTAQREATVALSAASRNR